MKSNEILESMNIKRRRDKKNFIKKPSLFLYVTAFVLVLPLLKILFKLEIDRSKFKLPKESFILLCNHQSYMDFLLVMLPLFPKRLNAITAQKFFFIKPLKVFLSMMGCIPKTLFEPDPRSIKQMIKVVRRGGNLLIFPEGRISTDGYYAGIHKAAGKLIKKLGVPVVSGTIEGAYVCMPYWRKRFKRGKLVVTYNNLISADETKSLSLDEINARIDNSLSKASTEPKTQRVYVNKNKNLLEGLEEIIYLCPCCLEEFTTETKGNIIRCTSCKCEAVMDRFTRLTFTSGGDHPLRFALDIIPESVQQWYRLQAFYEMKSLSDDMEPILIPVDLCVSSAQTGGVEARGRGILSLDSKGWVYRGELGGEEDFERFFPIDSVPALPFDPLINFQIYSVGKYHAFTPYENLRACMKYTILGECAYHRFAKEVMMTLPIVNYKN